MILMNVVVGILAGLAVPRMERWLKDVSESLWLDGLPISAHEFDLAAMLVILMIAAVVCAILGVDSSAFLLAFGALVGLFGRRIWRKIALSGDEA